MKHKLWIGILAAVSLSGCHAPPIAQSEFVIGSATAQIILTAARADHLSAAEASARRHLSSAWAIFDESNPKSEISKINRVAGSIRMKVSFNAFRAIDLAHYYSQRSEGAFDITLGPLRRAWGLEGPAPDDAPGDDELEALRALTGPQTLQLSDQRDVSILVPGGHLAMGDLVFAYGVDLAALELRQREIAPALVRWEDYARAIGPPGQSLPSLQRLPDPFANGAIVGEVNLAPDGAFALVRLWEHARQIGGQKFPGILDSQTGKPASGTALVAVRGPTCMQAHALATALLVRGREAGARLLAAFDECEVVLIPDRRPLEIWATPGMTAHLNLQPAAQDALRIWERPEADTAAVSEEPPSE